MALPLIMAGMSLVSGIAGNAQADANAKVQAKMLYNNMKTKVNSLYEQAEEVNRQVGMELTNLSFESLKNQASTSNALVESSISGRTAQRIYNSGDIKKNLIANQIKQKAESSMVSAQREMLNAKHSYEAGIVQTAVEHSNNTKSIFEVGTSAMTSFYRGGGSLDNIFGR